jgi:hypothetical protein
MPEDVHALMLRFMRLPGAIVGSGPLDPLCEEPALNGVVRKLLESDAALRADPDYVTFLKYFAGAALKREDSTVVHIWGPARAVQSFVWDRLALSPEDGFSPICCAQLPQQARVEFYLSSGPYRPPGVYWAMMNGQAGPEVEFHCAGFADLLREIVDTHGTFVPQQH